jgi:hypothetical protein
VHGESTCAVLYRVSIRRLFARNVLTLEVFGCPGMFTSLLVGASLRARPRLRDLDVCGAEIDLWRLKRCTQLRKLTVGGLCRGLLELASLELEELVVARPKPETI